MADPYQRYTAPVEIYGAHPPEVYGAHPPALLWAPHPLALSCAVGIMKIRHHHHICSSAITIRHRSSAEDHVLLEVCANALYPAFLTCLFYCSSMAASPSPRAQQHSCSVAKSNFPGYLSSEAPSLLSNHSFAPTDLKSYSDYLERDKPLGLWPYGVGDSVGGRVQPDSGVGVVTAGSSLYDPLEDSYRSRRQDVGMRSMAPGVYGVDAVSVSVRAEPGLALTAGAGYPSSLRAEPGLAVTAGASYPSSLRAQSLLGQRHEVGVGIGSSVSTDPISRERSVPSRSGDGLPVLKGESNILFVDGLPTDCTRREVGHLFRPFIGFQEIKVVHKEPRRSGDKAMVLCFVEFVDPKCALTAMEALQGYKFDDKKPNSLPLRIQFAHFPFRLPSDSDQKRTGSRH